MEKENIKFAGIDIGSNAIRIVISSIKSAESYKDAELEKLAYLRLPLRLGGDVFTFGEIREIKIKNFVNAMKVYRNMLDYYEIDKFRACATSATRSASNGKEVIQKIKNETGISIDVIDGEEESMLLYETNRHNLPEGKLFLSADLGGGSLQTTLFKGDELIWTHSYEIGTVRMINNTIDKNEMQKFEERMKEIEDTYKDIRVIGSGGNINKISKLIKEKTIEASDIDKLLKELEPLSVEQRMKKFELRKDRADVIVPAALIYKNLLEILKVNKIYVPKIGLADGIIRQLFDDYISKV